MPLSWSCIVARVVSWSRVCQCVYWAFTDYVHVGHEQCAGEVWLVFVLLFLAAIHPSVVLRWDRSALRRPGNGTLCVMPIGFGAPLVSGDGDAGYPAAGAGYGHVAISQWNG